MRSRRLLIVTIAAVLTVGALVAVRWHKPTATSVADASPATTTPDGVVSEAPSLPAAQKAALDWVASTDRLLAMGTIERGMWIAARVTPEAVTAMISTLDDGVRRIGDRLPIPASELRLLEIPLASFARLEGAGASVEVWSVVVFGAERFGSPRVTWRTITLHLAAIDGHWRIASLTDRAGPTPIAGDVLPSSWAEFAAAASWPRATERGGS
jgi:hypothetical protein